MARTVAECQGMIEAARQSCALLAIGHNRRYQSHIQLVRRLLKAGLIGEIERIEAEEGSLVDWPRSPAYFDPVESGGGCLIDVGIHSIDLIRWMASEFVSIEYIGNSTP